MFIQYLSMSSEQHVCMSGAAPESVHIQMIPTELTTNDLSAEKDQLGSTDSVYIKDQVLRIGRVVPGATQRWEREQFRLLCFRIVAPMGHSGSWEMARDFISLNSASFSTNMLSSPEAAKLGEGERGKGLGLGYLPVYLWQKCSCD